MLVITQKVGDETLIGDGISVRVLDVQGGRVKIGIAAPAGMKIVRRSPPTNAAKASRAPESEKKDLDFQGATSDTSTR